MHKPGSIFEAASQVLFSEAKKSNGNVNDTLAKLYPNTYPKKDELKAIFKKFPIEDEIKDNGDGTFSHPETWMPFKSKPKLLKFVSNLRKGQLE